MRKLFLTILAAMTCFGAFAQTSDAQKAAAEAAKAVTSAPETAQQVVKPNYWTSSLKTQINVGQTSLTNWAAGGDNTLSLAAFIDGNANWKKGDMFWNNRLQLDYGFLYASSKPILQKNTDRIYLESKWGYKAPSSKYLYFSANYDFRSQFSSGYDYKTPAVPTQYPDGTPVPEGTKLDQLDRNHQVDLWKDARVLKSDFLAPAYTNLALGIDFIPTKWLTFNIAPLTGGFVIVRKDELRSRYSMGLKKTVEKYKEGLTEDFINGYNQAVENGTPLDDAQKKYASYLADVNSGAAYRSAKFEFGAQIKADAKVNINNNFSYSTQVVLFFDYLAGRVPGQKWYVPRVNWDNRIDWKVAKYFSFTITTNLIYDDSIMIPDKEGNNPKPRVQFKESLAFGFTYTIASKK